MPVVSVEKNLLFKTLKQEYTEEGFDELCFEFGIELDDVVEEDGETIYKIDIPANRYDLLCLEGLARALLVFQGKESAPTYNVIQPSAEVAKTTELVVKEETGQIRQFVVACILRDITFTPESYQSFIDLQEQLHRNICRRRTLVSVGTHDLDTIQGPFTYEALPPDEICFKHLFADKEMKGKEMLDWFRTEPEGKHIKEYTDIIYDSPVYPVVFDSNRTVMSLPPIINGSHSKMSVNTKNVFIEATATDLTKAKIVLNTIIAMFARYCAKPESVEAVRVRYEKTGQEEFYPDMSSREHSGNIEELCSTIGVKIPDEEIIKLCDKMCLGPARVEERNIVATVPITRSDVLHAVDIYEDVAIAYGYNNIPRTIPVSYGPGRELPINHLSDILRMEFGRAGYTELMSLGLCSHDENFAYLNKEDDGKTAVVLSNPKTIEFQVVRTSLLPGTLKTLAENRAMKTSEGIKLFEVTDVVLLDPQSENGCRNERHLVALYGGPTAGVEIIHGLVDRIMQTLSVIPAKEYCPEAYEAGCAQRLLVNDAHFGEYIVEPEDNATFFPAMSAALKVKKKGENEYIKIGNFGAVHPTVLGNFKLSLPCSVFEMNLEPFL